MIPVPLRLIWDLLRGKCDPPTVHEINQVEQEQDELEPAIQELERAANFRRWQRDRSTRGY